jgi:hypothetical protein
MNQQFFALALLTSTFANAAGMECISTNELWRMADLPEYKVEILPNGSTYRNGDPKFNVRYTLTHEGRPAYVPTEEEVAQETDPVRKAALQKALEAGRRIEEAKKGQILASDMGCEFTGAPHYLMSCSKLVRITLPGGEEVDTVESAKLSRKLELAGRRSIADMVILKAATTEAKTLGTGEIRFPIAGCRML